MYQVLCVIPVRGGSKGIPRKNLLPIAGRPLLEWTVVQALQAQAALEGFAELQVVVSTDDAELAGLARAAGAGVPFLRPAELAQDTTPTEPVIEHALAHARNQGREPDAVMLLQATSPVRLPGTVERAVREFAASEADAMVGVVPEPPFIWHREEPVRAEYDPLHRKRRQEMTAEDLRYYENGSLYLTAPWVYDELHNRLGGRIELFVMDEREKVDIDTPLDFQVAEVQLRSLWPGEGTATAPAEAAPADAPAAQEGPTGA